MKLNLRAIDLNLLTIFDAIMEQGKLALAADILHMTQPAVSHALKRLRHTFDDELFIRTRQGMRPTPKALEIAPAIQSALHLIKTTIEDSQLFNPSESSRQFKIAFGRYGELLLLPQLLNKVNASQTLISIKSILDEQETGLDLVMSGAIDFCFDFVQPNNNKLEFCNFSTEELVVIARHNHPRLQCNKISLQQFFDEKHIVMTFGKQRRALLDELMTQNGGSRRIMAELNQYIAAPMVVTQTDGIALVPKNMADFFLASHEIRVMPLPLSLPPIPIYLIWHHSMSRDRGHQWMKKLILSTSATSTSA